MLKKKKKNNNTVFLFSDSGFPLNKSIVAALPFLYTLTAMFLNRFFFFKKINKLLDRIYFISNTTRVVGPAINLIMAEELGKSRIAGSNFRVFSFVFYQPRKSIKQLKKKKISGLNFVV